MHSLFGSFGIFDYVADHTPQRMRLFRKRVANAQREPHAVFQASTLLDISGPRAHVQSNPGYRYVYRSSLELLHVP